MNSKRLLFGALGIVALILILAIATAAPEHDLEEANFCTYMSIIVGQPGESCPHCLEESRQQEQSAMPGICVQGGIKIQSTPEATEKASSTPSEPPGTATAEPTATVDSVTICHMPGTPAEKTLTLPSAAIPGHIEHGDYLGECETTEASSTPLFSTNTPAPTNTPQEPPT